MPTAVGGLPVTDRDDPVRLRSPGFPAVVLSGFPAKARSVSVRGRPDLAAVGELRRSATVEERSATGRAAVGRSFVGRAADGRAVELRRSAPVVGRAADERSIGRLLIFWSLVSPVP